jgi:hypothetical protein
MASISSTSESNIQVSMKSLRQAYIDSLQGLSEIKVLEELSTLLFMIALGMDYEDTGVDKLLRKCETLQRKLLEEDE